MKRKHALLLVLVLAALLAAPAASQAVALTVSLNVSNATPETGQQVTLAATVADGVGPYTVMYSRASSGTACSDGGWTLIDSASAEPYSVSWTPNAAGSYEIKAEATDSSSPLTGCDTKTATVSDPPPDPPTVTLSVPSGVLSDTTEYTLRASATVGSGATIKRVAFYKASPDAGCGEGTLIDDDATGPGYTVPWQPPSINGNLLVSAVATDSLDRRACDSAIVTVDAGAPSAPTVTLSKQGTSAYVSGLQVFVNPAGEGSYKVTATANDPDVVAIRFPGGVLDDELPFSATYSLDELIAGTKSVTAVDSSGHSSSATQFEVIYDTAGPDPVAGFVTYPDGNVADVGGVINVSWAPGADLGAGLQAGSGFLERQTVPLVGVVCDFSTATWVQVIQTDAADSRTETLASKTCARYRYRISDNVANETIYAPLFVARRDPSDTEPPGPVRNARIRSGDHRVTLTYGLPFTPDFRRVKIYRWIAGKRLQTRGLLYTGTRTKVVDRGVFNGTRYVYQIVTCDVKDNCGLPGVLKWGTPKSRYLLTPRDGAVVTSPPRLTWRARTGALFYNVKLTRNGVVVLSRFPSGEALQLRWHWTYQGRTRRFTRGNYVWYVYPHFSSRYGALMGWSRFSKP